MSIKRFMIAAVCAFIFVFIYEFIVHGIFLKDIYEQTAELWRPEAEMSMPIMLLGQALFGLAVAFFYPIVGLNAEGCKKAMPFAISLGLVMAAPQIASYCYLPIPMKLSVFWMLTEFFKAFGTVLVVAKIYHWKQS